MSKKTDLASPDDEMKPTVSFSAKELPAIKDWKVGSSYKLVVEVKQTGLHQSDGEYGGGKETRATFEVQKVEPWKDPELDGFGDDEDE